MRYWIAKYGLILIAMFVCTDMFAQTLVTEKVPACMNYLHIRGQSNVNEFTFQYNSYPKYSISGDSESDTMIISIPIRKFETTNALMYNDFLELMKENKHPRIFITLSRKQLETAISNDSEPCPQIRITIAGVTRTYTVDCRVDRCSGNYYLKGKEIIKLSDFDLKPPSKLLGMVKVNNEIDVSFGFIITFTPDSKLATTL